MLRVVEEALTFDDVLLVPAHSTVLPSTVDLKTRLTRSITLNIPQDSVRQSLANMPDVYIDRWIKPTRGPYSAVWCAVSVPEHCPRPADDA